VETELLFARISGTTIVVITLSRNNTSDATFGVRAFTQPFFFFFSSFDIGQVFGEKVFVVGTSFDRVSALVSFSVRRWDANIFGTFGVINASLFVDTLSVRLDTNIFGTWLFVVTVFVAFTFWFIRANLDTGVSSFFTVSPFLLWIRVSLLAI
jgi:hypothetical protein